MSPCCNSRVRPSVMRRSLAQHHACAQYISVTSTGPGRQRSAAGEVTAGYGSGVVYTVHNTGRKPTAGAPAQDHGSGDEHRTLASHSLCVQLC